MTDERLTERTYTAAEVAELKAQCAAMLEKAAEHAEELFGLDEYADAMIKSYSEYIRALIPTDYAAALAEYERREFTAGIKVATLSITNENIEHPALVDFRAALAEVKRKARLEERRNHNYFYMNPSGTDAETHKAGFYYCLCGWEGPDRDSYWNHVALHAEGAKQP